MKRFRLFLVCSGVVIAIFVCKIFCWDTSPAGEVSTRIVRHAMKSCFFRHGICDSNLLFRDITSIEWDSLYVVPNNSFIEDKIVSDEEGKSSVSIDISELTQIVFLFKGKEVYRERLRWGGGVFHALFEDDGDLILGYQVEWAAPAQSYQHNYFYYYCNLQSSLNIQTISLKGIVLARPQNCQIRQFSPRDNQ